MRTVRLAFTDLATCPAWRRPSDETAAQISPDSPDYKLFLRLRALYELHLTTNDPDYVIYSVFGNDHLRYPQAVRIFLTGENVSPDFNICDYSFASDNIQFHDRHYRFPHYLLYDEFDELRVRGRTNVGAGPELSRRRFCNFVYSNSRSAPTRDNLFHLLSEYRPVDAAGSHLNNTDAGIERAFHQNWSRSKVEFQRHYKFTIACENSSTPGYTTEKLVHALAADTIPIYWGNPQVGREFNSRRFVNCHEFSSLDQVRTRVIQLDTDEDLYRATLNEPFFPDDSVGEDVSIDGCVERLRWIFDQPKPLAFRRNLHAWGPQYESNLIQAVTAGRFLSARDPVALAGRVLFKLWRIGTSVRAPQQRRLGCGHRDDSSLGELGPRHPPQDVVQASTHA